MVRNDWYAAMPMAEAGTVASARLRVQLRTQTTSHSPIACNDGFKRPTGSGGTTG